MYTAAITILAVAGTLLQFYNYHQVSKAQLLQAYYGTIAAGVVFIACDTLIAIRNPENAAILLFNLQYMWMVWTATCGLARLRK